MSETDSDLLNPKASEGKQIEADINTAIGHLRGGRATRREATDVKKAAEDALAGHDLSRGIGKL